MKILFVASRLPCPPISGDRLRAHHYIKRLSQRHDLTVVAPRWRETEEDAVAARLLCEKMVILPMSLPRQFARLRKVLFGGQSIQSCFFWSERIRSEIDRLILASKPDLLHVSMLRMAPAVAHIRHIPILVDFIDTMSLNMQRRSEMEESHFLRWMLRLESKRANREEQELIQRHQAITVVSTEDKRALGEHAKVHVVPLGVDLERFPFHRKGRLDRLLLFTGNLSYFPNADAVIYLVKEILPKIRAQMSDVRVQVVGLGLNRPLRRLGQQHGIEMCGYVPDLSEYLRRATVAVVPMRCGTGMQFKVLEAMASGAPVVATPRGLGGLKVTHGRELLIADSADSFAEEVIRLLQNPSLQEHLATNARTMIEKDFTWEESVRKLEAVYERAIASFA